MINIVDKKECCGCTACSSICPQNCIEMKKDIEGFDYPRINEDKCINCNICEKVCPVLNLKEVCNDSEVIYLVQNKNEAVRTESTSGGSFTPIAEWVINNGGVVYGVGFRGKDDYYVCHQKAETKENLYKFRGSKYVQSDINGMYNDAKFNLDNGRLVCFSGTPCQISGLKRFLRKDYENLITVDVVCRAVPSPMLWEKYVEYQNIKFNNKIDRFKFRDKIYGYSYSTMSVYAAEGSKKKDYHRGIESDLWLRMFFSGISTRPSCDVCKFNDNHESDFTVWDCFTVGTYEKSMDDNKGTTRMKLNTENAKKIFNIIKNEYIYKKMDLKNVPQKKEVAYSENVGKIRDDFYKELSESNVSEVFEKYFPYTKKIMILRWGRYITYRLGVYRMIKPLWDRFKLKKHGK